MKKTIIIALMALLPFGAFAQKFGHINSTDIIPLMTEYKSAQAELEELQKMYIMFLLKSSNMQGCCPP